MDLDIAIIIGVVAAIALTVLTYVFIMPRKKRATLNKFFKLVHDVFHFDVLFLEHILKFLYVLETLACVCIGFFMLFSGDSRYSYYGGHHFVSYAPFGLMILILGPIVVRIIYEVSMMFILLVSNTISINKKLKNQNPTAAPESAAPVAPVATPVAPAAPTTKECPACHAQNKLDSGFCLKCGQKLN